MDRSQKHAILVLVGVGLLAASACVAAESCNTTHLADQMYSFCCQPGEEKGTACCEAARSVVEISLAADPLCICGLEDEPAFLITGLSLDAIVRFYIDCGGRDSTAVHLVADRCYAPPPQQQHRPVDGEDIYADQPTPQ